MRTPPQAPQHVLDYLRDMVELCRNEHRPDLEHEYAEAWSLAASKVFGPLPPRPPCKGHYVAAPAKLGPPPKWKQELLAKPLRKIVRRFTELDGTLRSEYEQLECGHRVMAGIAMPGDPPARRRRCSECAHEATDKKTVSPADEPRRKNKELA